MIQCNQLAGSLLPSHDIDMSKVRTGPVFPVKTMTAQQRAEHRAELEELVADLERRRDKLAYWTMRKHHAETLPDIPEDLRQETFEIYARAKHFVEVGERLRAWLMAELQEQPEHTPAYHLEH